jgi:hypothetical protein
VSVVATAVAAICMGSRGAVGMANGTAWCARPRGCARA